MARPITADRVKETTQTTGTGTLALAGSAQGFQSFVGAGLDGKDCYYAVVDDPTATTEWEVGIGRVTAGTPNTLSRDRVLGSSNNGEKVSWAGGTKTVIVTATAEQFNVIMDTVDSDLVTAGSDTAYTLATNRPGAGLYEGRFICFKLHETCGDEPEINVDGTGMKPLVDIAGAAIDDSALIEGGYYWCKYNETLEAWVVFSPFGYLASAGGTMSGPLNMSAAPINEAEGEAIASATTVDLDTATGNFVHITGTTTIETVTLVQGAERTVVFDDSLTLTNGANLLLGGDDVVTAAGDVAIFRGEGSSVTRLVGYQRADQRTIQNASEAQHGAVNLLSNAEFLTGSDAFKAMVAANFVKSIGASGYVTLPGGLILQWGKTGNITNAATVTVTLPIPFTDAIYSIIATGEYTGSGTSYSAWARVSSLSQIQVGQNNGASAATPVFWVAIGK